MTDAAALRLLASEHDLEFVDLDRYKVDPSAAAVLPIEQARRHRAVPIGRKFGAPVIAIADPADVFALESLRSAIGRDFISVVADEEQIGTCLEQVYARGAGPPAAEPEGAVNGAGASSANGLNGLNGHSGANGHDRPGDLAAGEGEVNLSLSIYGMAFAPPAGSPATEAVEPPPAPAASPASSPSAGAPPASLVIAAEQSQAPLASEPPAIPAPAGSVSPAPAPAPPVRGADPSPEEVRSAPEPVSSPPELHLVTGSSEEHLAEPPAEPPAESAAEPAALPDTLPEAPPADLAAELAAVEAAMEHDFGAEAGHSDAASAEAVDLSAQIAAIAGDVEAAAELVDVAVAEFEHGAGAVPAPPGAAASAGSASSEPASGSLAGFPPLARVLVEGGRVSLEEMESVLEEHAMSRQSVARILTARGLVTEADLMWGMAEEMGLEFVDLEMRALDYSAAYLIPEGTARHHHVITISNEGGVPTVAASNPTDV
ncbi:MAG: GspE/PulE/PilB domain-containing protein, partial [Acidimicrobiales bacterium]